jgi:predicted metal-dependent peptidase
MACDFVINQMIEDSDPSHVNVQLPDGGMLDPKYRGWDAGSVFRDLKQQANNGSVHVKTVDNQAGKDVPVEDGDGMEGFDEHDWEGAEGMSTEEKETLARDIDQALRQGAILAGKLSANVPREIGELLQAKVDWREALREFVTSFCADREESTWRRPSRRIPHR